MRGASFPVAAVLLLAVVGAARSQEPPPGLPFVASNRRAIVVGAGAYEYMGPLNYTNQDAKAFAKLLIDQFRFDPSAVKLLTDDAGPLLTPTTGHILGEFLAAIADKKLDKADLFVFFFAGHGIGTPNGDFLLPTDARKESAERVGLPVKRLIQEIVDAGLKNVLVIADACRGGDQNTFGEELQRLGREANIAVMLGCQPGLRSYEYAPLGHGIFTHALLDAMRDPKLRDPISGALWASTIAEHVEKFVPEYTERDYPDQPQRPAAWTEKTQDILLGAFVPSSADASAVDAFSKQAKDLDRRSYGNALAEFGSELFDADRFGECVEVLKTLDQLGEMTAGRLYVLASALRILDRTAESTAVYDRVATSDEPYYRNSAIALNLSRRVPSSARLQAAEELWKLDQSPETAFLVWAVFMEAGVREAKLDFARAIALNPQSEERLRLFMSAEIAQFESRLAEAAEDYRKALSTPGEYPDDYLLRLNVFGCLEAIGKQAECEALLDEAIASKPPKPIWWIVRARRAKEKGDWEAMLASFRKALELPLSPGELITLVYVAGIYGPSLHSEVSAQADRMPYAWKALLAKALTYDLRDGPEKLSQLVDAAAKYCDDDLTFILQASEIQDVQLREGFAKGVIKADAYSTYQSRIYHSLLEEQERFGVDPAPWKVFVKFGLNIERTWQTAQIAKRLLSEDLEAGRVFGETAGSLTLIALADGDPEFVEKVFRKSNLKPGDVHDVRWLEAAFLACQGKFKEADTLAQPPEPGETTQNITVGLRAWILAALGKRKEAEAEIAKMKTPKTVEFAYIGLAWAALDEWEKAVPALIESEQHNAWASLFVHGKATEVLHKRYVDTKKLELADDIALSACERQIGTRQFKNIHFGPKPDLGRYVGAITVDTKVQVGAGDPEDGTLSLTFQSGGKVSGVFENSKGAVLVVSGTVDSWGNLSGSVRGEGGVRQIVGKLPPPEFITSSPLMKDRYVTLSLLDAKGEHTFWFLTPKREARTLAAPPTFRTLATTGSIPASR